jgi:predicted O-methyltransferase YrrM
MNIDTGMQRLLHDIDRAAWTAAAVAVASDDRHGGQDSAKAVLASAGLAEDPAVWARLSPELVAQAAAPILQAGAVLRGDANAWGAQPDEALLAQGRASAAGVAAFRDLGLPALAGLAAALDVPGVRMLDVGTGVAALAVAHAQAFPELTVVGLDVLPRALELARQVVAASDASDRVVLRQQDVSELDDHDTYALAWLPAPFVPETALRAGVPRIARALQRGGWLILAHARLAGDRGDDALTRFKTVAYGGTLLDSDEASALLRDAGLAPVFTVPTPPGAPGITVGRKA